MLYLRSIYDIIVIPSKSIPSFQHIFQLQDYFVIYVIYTLSECTWVGFLVRFLVHPGKTYDETLIFMGYPWGERATHTFSLFLAKCIYACSVIILPVYFSTKNDFSENFGISLWSLGQSLRFCQKPEICVYCMPGMMCVEFQRSKWTGMWLFWDRVWFFFAHFLASECECMTPFISANILQGHVWAYVHSHHTKISRKYELRVALRKIQFFIGKSGFLVPTAHRRS